jgi:chromosome segregation ATPase
VSAEQSRHAEAVRGLEAEVSDLRARLRTETTRADAAEQDVARLRAEVDGYRLRCDAILSHAADRERDVARRERALATPPTPPDALAAAEREAAEACVEHGRALMAVSYANSDRMRKALRALDAARASASAEGAREALVADVLRAIDVPDFTKTDRVLREAHKAGFLSRPGRAGEGA